MLGDAYEAPPDVADTRPRDTTLMVGGAPTDAASRFGGTDDPSRAPSFVYPEAATILPPNLVGLEIHFLPGASNDLFEFSFVGPRGTLRMYTRCAAIGTTGGCGLSLDTAAFSELARVAQPSGDVRITLRGTSSTAGGRYGTATRTLGIASTTVRGGLYYWAASSGSILRYEFGRAGARPELYVGGDPINCQGCHTMSRNGQRAAIGRFIPGPAITRIVDVPTRRMTSPEFGANFGTFSPDNTRLLSSDGARLALVDGYTGAAVPGLAAGLAGTMPDWSRNGRTVVFARPRGFVPPLFGSPGHNGPADLFTMSWSGGTFSTPTMLVAATGSENHFYPSFSPDDNWVLFNRGASSSFNAIDAHLYAVRADRSMPPVRLAAADTATEVGNSWPKWVPFVHSYQGEPLMWLTFSSRRDYGLRLQQQGREVAMRTSQLWMAAFRPTHAASGDPSAPAFWLPFQDLSTGNHIAQWSEVFVRQECTTDRDCASLQERCAVIDGANRCIAR